MPRRPTRPGVYIEAPALGLRTIPPLATAVTAFVGTAAQGPLNQAVVLRSFGDCARVFGGLDATSELSWGVRQFFDNGGTEAHAVRIDGLAVRQAIDALDAVGHFNLLVLPGINEATALADAVACCVARHAFLIIDAPADAVTPDDIAASVDAGDLPASDHAAVYYPWLQMADPLHSGQPRLTPPSGSLAGIYARTDRERGVWKAPAGAAATFMGALQPSRALSDAENERLNPLGVNCLRTFPGRGVMPWGARTLCGPTVSDLAYRYVNVRRLGLHIEHSVSAGLQWVAFEPNAEPLWAQIRNSVQAFLQGLYRQGAFQGRTPRDAYFVQCDRGTTTQADIDRGVVQVVIGFAPLKPAEFIMLRIRQLAGQSPG